MRVLLPNDFEPRPYQKRAMRALDMGAKRAITIWHRRAGKDLGAAHQTNKAAHEEVGMYWHFFPTFEQARRAIWEGYRKDGKRILENVFPGFLEPKRAGSIVRRVNHQQMAVELKCGSLWRLMGTDRVESVGAGPKGVVFSEFALCRPTAWDFVRPMLRESGGWAWFISTPRGSNHCKRLYDSATPGSGWYRDLQTVLDTGLTYASNRGDKLLSPEEMMAEERAEGMEEALIRQEYLCDWTAALVGSVWGDLLEALEKAGGVADFEHDTDGIFTSWDLGLDDSTAIWWWRPNERGGVDFLDHYETHGRPMSHYLDEVEARGEKNGWRYRKHWLPHDARARTLQTGMSILDQCLERWGAGLVDIVPSLSLADGVQSARWVLQQPTRFHSRCADGVEALKQYHYAYDEDAKTFSRKPVHDWASHSADGFRYACVVARNSERLLRKPEPPKRRPIEAPKLTLDQLWSEHEEMLAGGQ